MGTESTQSGAPAPFWKPKLTQPFLDKLEDKLDFIRVKHQDRFLDAPFYSMVPRIPDAGLKTIKAALEVTKSFTLHKNIRSKIINLKQRIDHEEVYRNEKKSYKFTEDNFEPDFVTSTRPGRPNCSCGHEFPLKSWFWGWLTGWFTGYGRHKCRECWMIFCDECMLGKRSCDGCRFGIFVNPSRGEEWHETFWTNLAAFTAEIEGRNPRLLPSDEIRKGFSIRKITKTDLEKLRSNPNVRKNVRKSCYLTAPDFPN